MRRKFERDDLADFRASAFHREERPASTPARTRLLTATLKVKIGRAGELLCTVADLQEHTRPVWTGPRRARCRGTYKDVVLHVLVRGVGDGTGWGARRGGDPEGRVVSSERIDVCMVIDDER